MLQGKKAYICSPLSAPTKEGIRSNMEDARKYMVMMKVRYHCRTIASHAYLPLMLDDRITEERETVRMCHTLDFINKSSDQVYQASDQVSSSSIKLSQGAVEQAASIEELSATIAEISKGVSHNSEAAAKARDNGELANVKLMEFDGKMKQLVVAMDEITGHLKEINKIIKTIEDIAFQTNILALNAAVEAARAGAAGKGFAVVADEVRNLASKSAEAAQSTTKLIGETIAAVNNGSDIAIDAADSLSEVKDIAGGVVSGMGNIADACSREVAAIEQTKIGAEQISNVVHSNSATSEESAAAAEEMSELSRSLKELVGKFKLKKGISGSDVPGADPKTRN